MTDLRQRAPGHSLIEKLIALWDDGAIRLDPADPDRVIIDDEAVSWYRGVQGERHVARLLARLGPEYTVLHSIPAGTGGRDIDHLVIGPTGVITINTKNSAGRKVWAAGFGLYVGNQPQKSYVKSALDENRQAASTLARATEMRLPVTTILVFVQPQHVQVNARVGDGVADIRVLPDDRLLSVISSRPVLTAEQVARASAAAADARTWLKDPPTWHPGSKIALEFDALDAAVGDRIRRVSDGPARPVPYSVSRSPSTRGQRAARPAARPAARQQLTRQPQAPRSPTVARGYPRAAQQPRQGVASRAGRRLLRLAFAAVGALVLFAFIANVVPLMLTALLTAALTRP